MFFVGRRWQKHPESPGEVGPGPWSLTCFAQQFRRLTVPEKPNIQTSTFIQPVVSLNFFREGKAQTKVSFGVRRLSHGLSTLMCHFALCDPDVFFS